MTERYCCDGRCNANQGRGSCPTFADTEDDPQIYSDAPIRVKRSMRELFGTDAFNPYEFQESGIPWLARSTVGVVLVVSLIIVALFWVAP